MRRVVRKPFRSVVTCSLATWLTLTFALAFALAPALAAPVEVTLMTHAGYLNGFEAMVEEFNASQDEVRVVLQPIAGDRNILETFIVQSAAGTPPDMVWHFETPQLAVSNMVAELTPYLERDGLGEAFLADFLPGLANRYTYQGRLYGLPFGLNIGMAIFYNADLVREAGLAEPEEGWNWQTFRQYVERLTRIDTAGNYVQGGFSYDSAFLFPWVLQNGGRAYDDERNLWLPDREKTLEALEFAVEIEQLRGVVEGKTFITQGYAMIGSGNYGVQFLGNEGYEFDDFELRSVHWPTNRGDRGIFNGGYGLHMSNTGDSARMDASWAFIRWMVQPEQQLKYVSITHQVPTTFSATQSPEFRALLDEAQPLRTFVEEAIRYGVAQPNPIGYSDYLTQMLYPRVRAALRGEVSPAEALIQLYADAEAYYSNLQVPPH